MRTSMPLVLFGLALVAASTNIAHAEPGRYTLRNATTEAARQNSEFTLHAQVQRKSASKSLFETARFSMLGEVQAPTANCSDIIFHNGFEP